MTNFKFYFFLKFEATTILTQGADRKTSPEIQRRMQAVKAVRLSSSREATQKLAETPYLFGEIRQKDGAYLAIPEVSSERRCYIPIGYLTNEIASNKLYMIPNANFYDFGILTSAMHMAWTRAVCGRLKSDYQYSAGIVYNNFPWPEIPPSPPFTKGGISAEYEGGTAKNGGITATSNESHPPLQKGGRGDLIETAAQSILDARAAEQQRCVANGQSCSLATLYAPGNMPAALLKAHAQLDKAVDAAYGYRGGKDDAARVAFLFERYRVLLER